MPCVMQPTLQKSSIQITHTENATYIYYWIQYLLFDDLLTLNKLNYLLVWMGWLKIDNILVQMPSKSFIISLFDEHNMTWFSTDKNLNKSPLVSISLSKSFPCDNRITFMCVIKLHILLIPFGLASFGKEISFLNSPYMAL